MGMSDFARRSQLTVKTFDCMSLNYNKSVQSLRASTLNPRLDTVGSDAREQIYLKLLQSTTSLDSKAVLHSLHSCKKKPTTKESGFVRRREQVPLELKSPPSKFRLHHCSGCSSPSLIQRHAGDAPCFRSVHSAELQPPLPTSGPDAVKAKKPEWIGVWNKASKPALTSKNRLGNDLEEAAATQLKMKMKQKIKELKTIFAVNGKVISLTGIGSEQFTNWFGNADLSDPPVRRRNILRRLDFVGYSDREISLKLFEGGKFVIEGAKAGISKRSVKHTFKLPEDLEVEALFLSRDKHGYLIIEKKVTTSL